MSYCERCDKLGFDKCLCPKPTYNYLLHISDHLNVFGYVDHLIKLGKEYDTPFTVEMIEPSMIVCYWQPGMAQVAWNESYKQWYVDQQKAYRMPAMGGVKMNKTEHREWLHNQDLIQQQAETIKAQEAEITKLRTLLYRWHNASVNELFMPVDIDEAWQSLTELEDDTAEALK